MYFSRDGQTGKQPVPTKQTENLETAEMPVEDAEWNRIEEEECCIESFQKKLIDQGVLTHQAAKKIWKTHFEKAKKLAAQIESEASPSADTIWDHTYVNNENADWRNF